ncbi:MAG: helix-turn-helix domain-containing protein [Nanoarchaeota archaeon]
MTDICERCGVSENEVRILDAIPDGRLAKFCERCAIIENITIIQKPKANQIKESEVEGIYERMQRLSGVTSLKKPEKRDLVLRQERLKELETNPLLEMPERKNLNLIEHFHWDIMKNRRRRGLTQQQLARAIGESETAVQMIENGKLPANAESLINKLEQFLRVRLRKIPYYETRERSKEPILLDVQGNRIDIIPEEEEMVFIEEPVEETEKETSEIETAHSEINDFEIDKFNPNKVTIGDLQKIHKKRVEATKLEQIEEQRKIEERKKIILAMREKERLILEEKKKQEFLEKQKMAQERMKIIEENKKRLETLKKREYEEVNKLLGGKELIKKPGQDERVKKGW